MHIALIHNPHSRRNARRGSSFARVAETLLGKFRVVSSHQDGLMERLHRLRDHGVRTLVIDGGDGTVSAVLTAIARVYPADDLPEIAVLASGNTNLIAHDVGFGLRGLRALRYLQHRQGAMRSSIRQPMCVSWPGSERLPVLGFFGGCAGYARAVRMAHQPCILRYAPHGLAVGVTVLGALGSLIFRRRRKAWLAGDPLRATTTDRVYEGASFMFLVTGLSRLSYGIWPFWTETDSFDTPDDAPDDTGLRYLDVCAYPKHLLRAAMLLLRGRAPLWLRQHPHYVSGRTHDLILETGSDFFLDGEVFSPTASRRIHLQSGPSFRFLHAGLS